MMGDATLFQRADMVEAAWNVVAPIQDVWERCRPREVSRTIRRGLGVQRKRTS